jgi:hypothetical protein
MRREGAWLGLGVGVARPLGSSISRAVWQLGPEPHDESAVDVVVSREGPVGELRTVVPVQPLIGQPRDIYFISWTVLGCAER